jgi:hypothetical protein
MFRCKEKRINWYLDRDLAKVITIPNEEGICAQLLFTPKGFGKHNDPFSLAKAENKCVVCGTDEDLTRHHVIPSMYRKHFPLEYKSNYHHDVLPICRTCHDKYELQADKLKKSLAQIYKIRTDYSEYFDISKLARDYNQYKEYMDDEKLINIVIKMNKFVGGNSLIKLEKLLSLREVAIFMIRNQGKDVIEKFDLQVFVKMWRSHFITWSKPKYMSEHWDINRSITKN